MFNLSSTLGKKCKGYVRFQVWDLSAQMAKAQGPRFNSWDRPSDSGFQHSDFQDGLMFATSITMSVCSRCCLVLDWATTKDDYPRISIAYFSTRQCLPSAATDARIVHLKWQVTVGESATGTNFPAASKSLAAFHRQLNLINFATTYTDNSWLNSTLY